VLRYSGTVPKTVPKSSAPSPCTLDQRVDVERDPIPLSRVANVANNILFRFVIWILRARESGNGGNALSELPSRESAHREILRRVRHSIHDPLPQVRRPEPASLQVLRRVRIVTSVRHAGLATSNRRCWGFSTIRICGAGGR
jgi:hypothetical protein